MDRDIKNRNGTDMSMVGIKQRPPRAKIIKTLQLFFLHLLQSFDTKLVFFVDGESIIFGTYIICFANICIGRPPKMVCGDK